MVQIDYHGDLHRSGRHMWADGHYLHSDRGRGTVAATSCSKGAIAYLAAFFMGQLAAWSLASGAVVLRAHQETSLTTMPDEVKARRAETLVERTAREPHQSIGV